MKHIGGNLYTTLLLWTLLLLEKTENKIPPWCWTRPVLYTKPQRHIGINWAACEGWTPPKDGQPEIESDNEDEDPTSGNFTIS